MVVKLTVTRYTSKFKNIFELAEPMNFSSFPRNDNTSEANTGPFFSLPIGAAIQLELEHDLQAGI
jgi:hypothetical protein